MGHGRVGTERGDDAVYARADIERGRRGRERVRSVVCQRPQHHGDRRERPAVGEDEMIVDHAEAPDSIRACGDADPARRRLRRNRRGALVVGVEHEQIVSRLARRDPHLRVRVVVERSVPVQMVGRDREQDRHAGLERMLCERELEG